MATDIATCNIHYVILYPEKPSDPKELNEYLVCELPIITTWLPGTSYVEEGDLGIALEDFDDGSFRGTLTGGRRDINNARGRMPAMTASSSLSTITGSVF